ncbi:MAG: hypothetical protein R3Y29_03045 [bacterium]
MEYFLELSMALLDLTVAIAKLIFVLYILYLTYFTDRILPVRFDKE